jgi:hypothetical protein
MQLRGKGAFWHGGTNRGQQTGLWDWRRKLTKLFGWKFRGVPFRSPLTSLSPEGGMIVVGNSSPHPNGSHSQSSAATIHRCTSAKLPSLCSVELAQTYRSVGKTRGANKVVSKMERYMLHATMPEISFDRLVEGKTCAQASQGFHMRSTVAMNGLTVKRLYGSKTLRIEVSDADGRTARYIRAVEFPSPALEKDNPLTA